MADNLQLDIVVDDHGAVQKLDQVDAGVAKVVNTAKQGTPSMDELNQRFADSKARLDGMATSAPAAAAGMSRVAMLASGGALAGLLVFAVGLRNAGLEADKFAAIGERLSAPAARIQAITTAAADNHVTVDQMTGALGRFQQRLASGAIDDELRDIGVELAAFKQLDVTEQFLQITDAVGGMEDPLDRVNARVRVLGTGSEEMAGLMTRSFREATDSVITMRDETIVALNEVTDAFTQTWNKAKSLAVTGAGEFGVGLLNLMGRDAWRQAGADKTGASNPTPFGAPSRDLPAGPSAPDIARAEDLMRVLELQREQEENWYRIDEIMRGIDVAQKLIVKSGGDWSDVLDTRVAASLDTITGKLQNAIILNTQLGAAARQERDQILAEISNPANPNESEFDRKFNQIDQRFKADMAKVDQTDREVAARTENDLLERMNAEMLKLQQNWEKATVKTTEHGAALGKVKQQYEEAFQPQGGTALPGGLVMPTAEQIATGRYFGPVTPNGQPDPSRMAGATPITNNFTLNAQGALFDTPGGLDNLVRKIEELQAQRDAARGGQVRR